jgi:hypothetical protein
MPMIRTLLAAAFALTPAAALGCMPNPDPDLRPWGERVAGSNPMFIGTVTEIRGQNGEVWTETPKCKTIDAECEAFHYGLASVVFTVELPINGDLRLGDFYIIEQGRMSDCRIEFRLGQRWLYAGFVLDSPSMYLNEAREGLN